MRIGGIILGACCALGAAIISVHFFLSPQPEAFLLESSPSGAFLSGLSYEQTSLSFSHEQRDALFPLSSSRYSISPPDFFSSSPLPQFALLQDSFPVLYFWHEQEGYWSPLFSHHVTSGQTAFSLARGGIYAPGEHFSVVAPAFVDALEEIRTSLPEHAVWYDVALIATVQGGAPVLVTSHLERGGCGGIPVSSGQEVTAHHHRTVQVLVNDVLTETTFTFFVRIGILDGGCPEDMPLRMFF